MEDLRVAILADIHGNPIALDAVLEDIEARDGADEFWLLGDLAAIGYAPLEVLQRLAALPQAHFIRGNTDRYIVTGELPGPPQELAQKDPKLFKKVIEVASSFAWTAGAVTTAGWGPWLAALPLEMRRQLPNGKRVLAAHAAPGTDDGNGIRNDTPDEELRNMIAGADADLILVAHTHVPFDRMIDGVRVVNPGSVSNPFSPDLRACYAFLTCSRENDSIELRRVDYNHQAAIEATLRSGHPAANYIAGFLRGEKSRSG